MSNSLQPHKLYSPWNSPGQNATVGSLLLLKGIFPIPGIEPRSPTLQADSLPTELQGKPCNAGDPIPRSGTIPLEKQMATHSSILAWEIPLTEEPDGQQSMGSQELDMTYGLNHHQSGIQRD